MNNNRSLVLMLGICLLLYRYVAADVAADIAAGNITCDANGDVYIRAPGWTDGEGSGVVTDAIKSVFAEADGHVCPLERQEDYVRIYGCQSRYCPITVLATGATSLYIVSVSCNQAGQQETSCKSIWDYNTSRRRRQSENIIGPGLEESVNTSTSAVFSVKLVFNSNDEISIECNPDGHGILYVSNPDPERFYNALAFVDGIPFTCEVTFLDDGKSVAISNCNLYYTIIVAFSSRQENKGVIGGDSSTFRVYKIDCAEDGQPGWSNVEVQDYDISAAITVHVNAYAFGLMFWYLLCIEQSRS